MLTPQSHVVLPLLLLLSLLLGSARSDVNQDKTECANQLVALATCLPYVGGDAKTPTMDCCAGLKQVLDKSKKCLCLLIKDKDDPSLGLKINTTLAATLPTACHSPANISDVSECVSLLHLPPNSPDAKIFQGFANATHGHGNAIASPVTSGKGDVSSSGGNEKSDGGSRRNTLEIAFGVMAFFFASFLFIS